MYTRFKQILDLNFLDIQERSRMLWTFLEYTWNLGGYTIKKL